ncbi:MAG: hypothetical protein JW841_04565 [Deltaproteobacteria bacterium]|nr:hypothetical protein [Deltaproteobacteria bacterium]
MASEDLSIKSGKTSSSEHAAPTTDPREKEKRAREAALEKIRSRFKQRYGEASDEAALLKLILQRKEKVAKAQRINITKAENAAATAKTTVKLKKDQAQEQIKKTTGNDETRGADGLGNKARAEVRGDPKARVYLPPIDTAINNNILSEALDSMLASMLQENAPIDVKAYAKTLKEVPPTQIKDANAATASSLNHNSTTAKATAAFHSLPNQPGSPAAKQPQSQKASPSLASFGLRPQRSALMPLSRSSQSPNDSKQRSDTNANSSLIRNAGGGLTTNYGEGVHFNWEAFFINFMMECAKDDGAIRILMNEMRTRAANNNILARQADIEFTKRKHEFDKYKAYMELGESLVDLAKAVTKAVAEEKANLPTKMKADLNDMLTKPKKLLGPDNKPILDKNGKPKYGNKTLAEIAGTKKLVNDEIPGESPRTLLTKAELADLRKQLKDENSELVKNGFTEADLNKYEQTLESFKTYASDIEWNTFLNEQRNYNQRQLKELKDEEKGIQQKEKTVDKQKVRRDQYHSLLTANKSKSPLGDNEQMQRIAFMRQPLVTKDEELAKEIEQLQNELKAFDPKSKKDQIQSFIINRKLGPLNTQRQQNLQKLASFDDELAASLGRSSELSNITDFDDITQLEQHAKQTQKLIDTPEWQQASKTTHTNDAIKKWDEESQQLKQELDCLITERHIAKNSDGTDKKDTDNKPVEGNTLSEILGLQNSDSEQRLLSDYEINELYQQVDDPNSKLFQNGITKADISEYEGLLAEYRKTAGSYKYNAQMRNEQHILDNNIEQFENKKTQNDKKMKQAQAAETEFAGLQRFTPGPLAETPALSVKSNPDEVIRLKKLRSEYLQRDDNYEKMISEAKSKNIDYQNIMTARANNLRNLAYFDQQLAEAMGKSVDYKVEVKKHCGDGAIPQGDTQADIDKLIERKKAGESIIGSLFWTMFGRGVSDTLPKSMRQAAEKMEEIMRNVALEASQRIKASTEENRKRMDQSARRIAAETRGMINQLIYTLALARNV